MVSSRYLKLGYENKCLIGYSLYFVLATVNLIMEKEFKIGETVTLDRYNHIEDAQKVKVIGYGRMFVSNRLTYKLDVNGVEIESTGISIMESKLYSPVPDKDRHHRLKASAIEIEEYWDRKRGG
jgi:D-hexose-6-phosphate mutarotase